jgi:hypothetical protein
MITTERKPIYYEEKAKAISATAGSIDGYEQGFKY